MRLCILVALAAAVACAIAQDPDDDDGGIELGPKGANNRTTPTEQDGRRTIHYVTVGKIEHEFQPNSIVAAVGDIVSFQFFPLNHSVIQAKYGYPCVPIDAIDPGESMFYSEFFPVNSPNDANPPTWNLTIDSTEPIFYYCGANGSCTDWGMLGAINANGSTPLATQMKLAHEADYMLLPGQEFPSEAVEASLSALAHSATVTTTTEVVTKPPSSTTPSRPSQAADSSSGGLSSGAVAGIAVGAAIVALVVAALFFLMCRTRSLMRKLELKRAASGVPPSWQQPGSPGAPSPYTAGFFDPNRQSSQLPPYRPYHHLERPDMNKTSRVESWSVDAAGNPMLASGTTYPEGYHSPPMPPPEQGHWPLNARSTSPAAELDVRQQEMIERRTSNL